MEKNIDSSKWYSVKEKLPEPNVVVRVLLINGIETFDFVNEPVNNIVPFQRYLVERWRLATREELLSLINK